MCLLRLHSRFRVCWVLLVQVQSGVARTGMWWGHQQFDAGVHRSTAIQLLWPRPLLNPLQQWHVTTHY